MPGNETIDQSRRVFLPAEWRAASIPAGQATPIALAIPGFTAIDAMPLAERATLRSVGIVLSQPVTAGLIRFQLTRDGALVGPTFDMTSASGDKAQWTFKPGELVGAKGAAVGVALGTSGTLAPAGVIEALVVIDVQFVGG
jgi:hypothetical protein